MPIGTTTSSRPDAGGATSAAGLFSVLQFGLLIPPLGTWETEPYVPALAYPKTLGRAPADPVAAVEQVVDRALAPYSAPVILFSGGVDSGLIAARSKRLGQDPLLVNYAFGPDDPQSHHAERMARHLGLRFRRVVASAKMLRCLDAPGSIYPAPFADYSTPAFVELADAAIADMSGDAVVFDGAGADGCFGFAPRTASWMKLYRVPVALRRLAATGYGRLWLKAPSRRERWTTVLRRSAEMPFPAAAFAQNALASIVYDQSSREQVLAVLADYLRPWRDDPMIAHMVVDLGLVCAGIYAQRAGPLFQRLGVRAVFPFLTDSALALASTDGRSDWGAKVPLKEALARHVPRELVYRPKSGLTPPLESVFHQPVFLDHLEATTSGQLSAILDHRAIADATNVLHKGRPVPVQTANFLWAVTFLDRWLRTVPPAASRSVAPASHPPS